MSSIETDETQDSNICCICEVNKINFKTLCNHSFCSVCIIKWIIKSKTCPICRTPINVWVINIPVTITWKMIFLLFLICNHYFNISSMVFYIMMFFEFFFCVLSFWKTTLTYVIKRPINYV